jgi:hypothetical protein
MTGEPISHYAECMPMPIEGFAATGEFWPWNSLDSPKTLYHYTDASGALGILSGNEIWASDAFFLNDSSELQFGLDIIYDVWKEARRLVRSAKQAEWLDGLLGLMHQQFADVYSTYLSCFCEEGNLLSQWRGYGKIGTGFALGIDGAKLKQRADGFQLVKVEYNPDAQRELCETYFNDLCGALADDNLSDENIRGHQLSY